jgi:hypothetical protein
MNYNYMSDEAIEKGKSGAKRYQSIYGQLFANQSRNRSIPSSKEISGR